MLALSTCTRPSPGFHRSHPHDAPDRSIPHVVNLAQRNRYPMAVVSTLRIAHEISATEAEGPHLRFAVWTQGCSLRCPGCCNPELFSPTQGRTVEVDGLVDRVSTSHALNGIEGITVVGGEPLDQLESLLHLTTRVAAMGLGIIVFTGYRRDEVHARRGFAALWRSIDTLVDGRFLAKQPERERRYLGSTNQRLWHRTSRYANKALWYGAPVLEIRPGADAELALVGSPRLVSLMRKHLGRAVP